MTELRSNLDRLIRRWGVLAIALILGAGGGMLYATLTPPAYTASAIVVVAQEQPTGDGRDVSYAQAFGRLVGQEDMAARVAATTLLPVEAVLDTVRATTSPDAPMIEIIGTTANQQDAATLVNGVADELVRTAGASRTDTGVRLFVLSPAIQPNRPSSPDTVVSVAVGAAAGFLLGGLLVLASNGRAATGRQGAPRPAGVPAARPADPNDQRPEYAPGPRVGPGPPPPPQPPRGNGMSPHGNGALLPAAGTRPGPIPGGAARPVDPR